MKLKSSRLLAIADVIRQYKQGNILADIGTDHAYLPCFLLDEGIITHAYACDIASGPLASSKETIAACQLQGRVEALLGDGLGPIVGRPVDMIAICGMGGLLMSEILDAHPEFFSQCIFFLQANTALDLLRGYLVDHDLSIIDEFMVKDAKHIYEIMVVKCGKQSLSERDLIFGPVLRQKKEPLFYEKWQREKTIQERILASLSPAHEKYPRVLKMKEMIEEEIGG